MSNSDEPGQKKPPENFPNPTAPPHTAGDVENQAPEAGQDVSAIVGRWRREDLLKRGSLVLRGSALVFSLISFLIMVSNRHGDWKNFDNYEEYRYVLAIAILSNCVLGGSSVATRTGALHRETPPLAAEFGLSRLFRRSNCGIPADIVGVRCDPDDKQDEGGERQHFYRLLCFLH